MYSKNILGRIQFKDLYSTLQTIKVVKTDKSVNRCVFVCRCLFALTFHTCVSLTLEMCLSLFTYCLWRANGCIHSWYRRLRDCLTLWMITSVFILQVSQEGFAPTNVDFLKFLSLQRLALELWFKIRVMMLKSDGVMWPASLDTFMCSMSI